MKTKNILPAEFSMPYSRKDFLKTGALLGATSLLPANSIFSASVLQSPFDKIVDDTGTFVLGPLPYNFDTLEPHMDAETLELHYKFHHGGAVKGANKDAAKIRETLENGDLETVDFWTHKLAYHLSSHVLHSIFWTNLNAKPSQPRGALLKAIERDFGTFDKFKSLLTKTSTGVDGSGWAIFGYQAFSDRLMIIPCDNHERLTAWGLVPLLVIDVWEHAYYLKHRNRRGDFVDALFALLDWDNARARLEAVRKLIA